MNHTLTDIFGNINNWMNDHNLEINFTKTKLMQFRPHQKTPIDINFTYNNIKLECVDTFSLLGVQIDTNISWKNHVLKIRSKLSSFAYALRELRRATDLKTALSAYYSYAHAWLTYGILLWGNSVNAQHLLIAQKKCIRTLACIKEPESCRPHFIKNKILTVTSIYILEVAKFVRQYPQFFQKQVEQTRRYATRFQHKLILPTSRLNLHSSGPNVMSIKIYNNLPNKIKVEQNDRFYSSLKQLLLEKCYYNLSDFFNDKFNEMK